MGRIIAGFQNSNRDGEDFALTPFLHTIYVNRENIKIYGVALCWGWYSVYVALGINLPKECPTFMMLK